MKGDQDKMKDNIEVKSIVGSTVGEKVYESFIINGDYQIKDAIEGRTVYESREYRARSWEEAHELALGEGLDMSWALIN